MAFSKAICLVVFACAMSSAVGSIESENALGSARKLLGGCGWCKLDNCKVCKFGHHCRPYCEEYYYHPKPAPSKAFAGSDCNAAGGHHNGCASGAKTFTEPNFANSQAATKGFSGGSFGAAGAKATAHGPGAITGAFTKGKFSPGSAKTKAGASSQNDG